MRRNADPAGAARGCRSDRTAAGVDDLARDITAGDMGQRQRDSPDAAPLPEVEMIERARANPHDRATVARRRVRRILVAKNLRAAVLVKSNSLHVIVTSDTAPRSSVAAEGDTFSRSPMITVSRREGSMSAAATRMMSAAVSASTFGTKVVK